MDRWLSHWGRMTHICVSKLTIIGWDNGLSPGRRQAIIWTNAGIFLIRTSGTNFSEIINEINSFSFSKMNLKMASAKWRLFGLGLNELMAGKQLNNYSDYGQEIKYHTVVVKGLVLLCEALLMIHQSIIATVSAFDETTWRLYTSMWKLTVQIKWWQKYLLSQNYTNKRDNSYFAMKHYEQPMEGLLWYFKEKQGKSEGFDSCNRPSNLTQIGLKW